MINNNYIEKKKYPLSSSQQSLYLINTMYPNEPIYNDAFTLHFNERINTEVLQNSLDYIIKSNETFRLVFNSLDGKPYQFLIDEFKFPLEVTNIEKGKENLVHSILKETMKKPFDLSNGPLVRGHLLFTNDGTESILFFVSHHIILDGYSIFNLLVPQLERIYDNLSNNQEPIIQQSEIEYIDYAIWKNSLLEGDYLNDSINFWKNHLKDIKPLKLPNDYDYSDKEIYRGCRSCFEITSSETSILRKISEKNNLSLSTILLSAAYLLFNKYSNEKDLVLGTVTSGRENESTENIMGNFVNSLPIKVNIENAKTFNDLCKIVNSAAMGSYQHQDLPFERIVNELRPERNPNRNAIFQVPVVFQPKRPKFKHPWKIELFDVHADIAKFELSLTFDEQDDKVIGAVEYRANLFMKSTIDRMIGHILKIVHNICNNFEFKLDSYSLVTKNEYQNLIIDKNSNKKNYNNILLHQFIELQAKRTPENIALEYKNFAWTYKELNSICNNFAKILMNYNLEIDDVVAIYLPRIPEMVISMFATLKAGAAYLPVDIDYPLDRIEYMFNDSKAKIIITTKELSCQIDAKYQKNLILVDDYNLLSGEFCENINRQVNINSLAYIIYTSGSTGMPKGVMISHKSISNHMQWIAEQFNINENDKVLQKTAASFDASVWEFYAPLMVGGTLILAPQNAQKDVNLILDLINKHEVTIIQGVPSFIKALSLDQRFLESNSLRMVFSGGEALEMELVNLLLNKNSMRFINLYGPTEACIDSVYWECDFEDKLQIAPIGNPVTNCFVVILDENKNIVPIGVPGELYIGGLQLASGYLNNPKLTTEKFIKYNIEEYSVLYKTGDIVKWGNDGLIHYLGRNDNQVKYKGYRIELEEIENAIQKVGQVSGARVVIDKSNGNQKLVAFVEKNNEENLTAEDIKVYVRNRLPEYMIPEEIIILSVLPKLPNGKVNKHELLNELKHYRKNKAYCSDKTQKIEELSQIEYKLLNIWKKILKIDDISIYDNFYKIGGDSLLSMMVQSLANREGINFSAKDLMEYQTIENLTDFIMLKENKSCKQEKQIYESKLTSAQLYVKDISTPDINNFTMSSVIDVPIEMHSKKIQEILNLLIERHTSLKTKFKFDLNRQELTNNKELLLDHIKVNEEYSESFNSLIEKQAYVNTQKIDCESGYVINGTLFEFIDSFKLLLTAHYLVADGMSWRIIEDDIKYLCAKSINGELVKNEKETASFLQWSNVLFEYANKLNTTYWNKSLWESCCIPFDYDKSEKNSLKDMAIFYGNLSEEDTNQLLRKIVPRLDMKMSDFLIGILGEVICNEGNKISINFESYGRDILQEEIDVSRTVGCFTVVYPIFLQKGRDVFETLNSIRVLNPCNEKGIHYSLLRYMSTDLETKNNLEAINTSHISFNYMGQFEKNYLLFNRSDNGTRKHLIEIDCFIEKGQYKMFWKYNQRVHSNTQIQEMWNEYLSVLKKLIRKEVTKVEEFDQRAM